MATRQHALSGHMTARRLRAPPHACVLRRGCEALRGEAPPPAPRWGPVRAEALQPPPPPWLSRGLRCPTGRRREPCRSGSGAARCALTAACRVSPSGGARSPLHSRLGPLPRGRPHGSGGSRRPSPTLRGQGRHSEEPGQPWGGSRPGPVRAGRAGGRRPLFALVPPVPGLAERGRCRGRGRFFNRKGLGQCTGRPITEVKCERPPSCGPQRCRCHLLFPGTPRQARAPPLRQGTLPGVGSRRPSLRRNRPPDPETISPLPTFRLPLRGRESPGRRGSGTRTRHLGVNAYLRTWHLNGLSYK